MITDYFLHTNPIIKSEKKPGNVEATIPTKDILQDKRYNFDHSAVLEDDDLEILEVLPSKDTEDHKAIPFIYIIPDDDEVPIKSEPAERNSPDATLVTPKTKADSQITDGLLPKIEKNPYSPIEEEKKNDSEVDDVNGDTNITAETISLEGDQAKDDQLEEQEKKSDRENSLLLQIETLSKG